MRHDEHVIDHDAAKVEFVQLPSRSKWLEARQSHITATDIGGICGVGKYSSKLSVFADKLTTIKDDADEEDERMLLGRVLQGSVAEAYALIRSKKEGCAVSVDPIPENSLFIHATHTLAAASLDAVQSIRGADDEPDYVPEEDADRAVAERLGWPLEIKVTEHFPDSPPDYWLTQVQWQMYVTGSRKATIAVLCGGSEIRWWDIDRCDDVIDAMREEADRFWTNHVVAGVPPESDGSERSRGGIRAIFPRHDDGPEVRLGPQEMNSIHEILKTKSQIAALEVVKRAHEDAIMRAMGTAGVAFAPDGTKVTWKVVPRAAYTVAASAPRVFRIILPKTKSDRQGGTGSDTL